MILDEFFPSSPTGDPTTGGKLALKLSIQKLKAVIESCNG